jgi:hypothetical protein
MRVTKMSGRLQFVKKQPQIWMQMSLIVDIHMVFGGATAGTEAADKLR